MKLQSTYNRDEFLHFLNENFLADFKKDIRSVSTQGSPSIQKTYSLGRSERLDLQVFEFSFEGSANKRVTLTKDAFQIMKSSAIFRALAIFHSPNNDDWRLSLMTATPERTEKGKVALSYSNPKRLSFFLGPNAKVNTPTKFILKKGKVIDFDDLKSRFSIEVVNKEFYQEISGLFTQLVGGSLQSGKKMEEHKALLKLPDIQDHNQTSLEFAVRLIGRVIFCWFLREKKSDQGKSLMPHDLLSPEAVKNNSDYYHTILEPIFFEVLNKPIKSRKDAYAQESFSSIAYLNGGLFSPHDDDFFSYNESKQAANHNAVIVPDEWLLKFFEVLETYNFTIDENTGFDEELSIDPEMLGRIFENLLAEINPETGESARKSTGSYYTPRVIVDYMVDESLLLYLKKQTQIDEEKLRAVISYDLTDDEQNLLTEDERGHIINALDKVKILDPACGSGAFPMGALQKIVFILQQADPEGKLFFKKQIKNTSPEIRRLIEREFAHKNFDYIRKLGVIRENIYGVDIQPIATEISRLRCFLTIVVDERIQEDLENRGIEPLPNLDFKFVTANTLIGLPDSEVNSQRGLFEDAAGIEELRELRDMFFNAFGAERDQLKLQFVQAQNKMFQRLISEGRRVHADLTTKLTTWDPFSHKSASWFDSEWMFSIKDGFDILIGNPPYIQLQKLRGNPIQQLYKGQNFRVYDSDGDIYCLFYERGIKLLRERGILTYITSNKWIRAAYGEKLRSYFLQYNSLIIINLGPKVFQSATVDTNILIIQKVANQNSLQGLDLQTNGINNTENLSYLLKIKGAWLQNMGLGAWHIASNNDQELREKIESIGVELKNWKVKINRGILTGINEAFIIDQATRDRLVIEDTRSTVIIKPILQGKDIGRYVYQGRQKYVIATFPALSLNIDNFPAIKKHLLSFGIEKLEQSGKVLKDGSKARKKTNNKWYETQDTIAYWEEFAKEKIVWKRIGSLLRFAYDSNGMYAQDSTCIMTGPNLKYLCAYLNSKLSHKLLFDKAPKTGTGDLIISVQALLPLPVPPINRANQHLIVKIEELFDRVYKIKQTNPQIDTSDIDKQIDQLVYKLYDLTEEEIEIVEEQTSARVAIKPILKGTLANEEDQESDI